jgi:hypothetical protein
MSFNTLYFRKLHQMFRYTLFLSLAGCADNIGSQQVPKDNFTEQVSIQEIIYKSYGGDMGYSMALHITKDRLTYFSSLAINNKNSHLDTINTIQFWDSLTTKFDIANFKKIKNGYSNQPVDGTDQQITIITNTSDTISVVNAYQDTLHYRPIMEFEQLIRKKANTLY